MNTNPTTPKRQRTAPTVKLLILTSTIALCGASPAEASIAWVNVPTATYNAGSTTTFNGVAPASAVTVDFSSNISGSLGVSTSGTQINLVTTSLISAGTTLNFFFDLNMQLGSGGAGKRAASQLRLARAPGPGIVNPALDLGVLVYGGNDTLENYFDAPVNDNPVALWENTGVFQTTGSGNVSFDGFPFENPNTAGYSATAQAANTFLSIVDPTPTTVDFSFSGVHYNVTLGGDLEAGSSFLFTLGGAPIGPAIPIPEPSQTLLLSLGLASFTLRRRR